jgi:hypothetical protein
MGPSTHQPVRICRQECPERLAVEWDHHHSHRGSLQRALGERHNLDGIAADRSNAVGDINLPGGRSRQQKIAQYFSTAAFAQGPAGVPYGNAERNIGIGPSFINTDFSAFKNFSVWRESNLQFRADFFNLFNNVNLANPNTTLTSPSFGKISPLCANATPRVIQFALKVLF